ncbi:MAG TPA: response regulator transcription factor [Gaiellaceae bacterium]|nr:response regulator transcription factor [Gaiellaceae bacterium]
MSARILVVDDEPALLQGLAYALTREHFEVATAADGEAALEAAREHDFDLIILDLMLPKLSGIEVCRRLRAESAVPIIMLTAKDSEVDKVVGLEVGADDYVTKPFSALELLGRVRALLRRRELDRTDNGVAVREVGGLRVDFARHELTVDGEPVSLTPSEFKVLYVLAQRPEEVVSKRAILEHLWESTYVGDQHACDVHISNLRRKLERDPSRPERIVTVRGFGYKLMPA